MLHEAIRDCKKQVHVNTHSESPCLEKRTAFKEGWHQDSTNVIRLLFKTLLKVECAILLKMGFVDDSTIIPTSDDECIVCAICFNDTNCKGSSYEHRGVVKDDLALTIVLDLLHGVNPCVVAEK